MSEDIRKDVLVNVYGKNAPAAARFGVGAKSLAEIKQATDARRALSREQSTPKTTPVRRD